MGGDTNIVEDAIDRLPAHTDADEATTELDKLKSYLGLVDGWRATYPTTRAYTYLQAATNSQSRIDRIYVNHRITDQTYEWEIQPVGFRTDHQMVSVRMTTANAPTTGPGRWVWPKFIMSDKVLKEYIQTEGLKLLS
jgi:exonuclease III